MPIQTLVRPGAYYDSVVLMQVQRALAALPGVEEAGVVMGTTANKELLAMSDLLTPEGTRAAPEDLIIAVLAANQSDAEAALSQVDALFARRRSADDSDYRPHSLAGALSALPHARWALVSTPGRYAAGVAREALALGLNVFLYSDNVPIEDEVALKQEARTRGLLVMGPDCGTAIINGTGLGFANRVRRGAIGLVGASGTGLQYLTTAFDRSDCGITHAIGTGGRDLSEEVGAITTLQALKLLQRDPETKVIVVISKPPATRVVQRLTVAAHATGKHVIFYFLGLSSSQQTGTDVFQVSSMQECIDLATYMLDDGGPGELPPANEGAGYLRGLFSGGTLAYEAQSILSGSLAEVWSNAPLDKRMKLPNALHSQGHTILDLGDDEFTVGRLHPMLDNDLRIKRLMQEAADPEVASILLDVVLGDGAHPDPAAELAPAIRAARELAAAQGRELRVVVLLVGTESDPQDYARQFTLLNESGAMVVPRLDVAVQAAAHPCWLEAPAPDVPLDVLTAPFAAINIGLESFTESLRAQGAEVVHVDWKPPAGGNERLMGILSRMKNRTA